MSNQFCVSQPNPVLAGGSKAVADLVSDLASVPFTFVRNVSSGWKKHLERCPLARRALDLDNSTILLNDGLSHGESQAAPRVLGCEEWIKHLSLNLVGHSASRI